ncbi:hypothetical protein BN1200_980016 [Klebsiella variicola]|nr:hypothetical protein BN1200_980016 [Klebsiella variicola]
MSLVPAWYSQVDSACFRPSSLKTIPALREGGAVRQNLSKQQPAAPGDGAICTQYSIQLLQAPPCR